MPNQNSVPCMILAKKNETPEQLLPMEPTIPSHSKPDVKPKIPSPKSTNKKAHKQSADLLRQQPARNCNKEASIWLHAELFFFVVEE